MKMSHKDPETAKNAEPAPRESRGPAIVSIGEYRIRREIPRVLPAFEAWCREKNFDVRGDALKARITAFLGHYARLNRDSDITFLNVQAFAATLDELMFFGKTNDFLDMTHVFGAYLEFLHATGTWGGTHEQFVQLDTYFKCFSFPGFEPSYSPIPELQAAIITVPKLSEDELAEAIGRLPVARRVLSFLQWLGPRREITSLKVLNKKHVQEAAAALDVDAVPVSGALPVGGQPTNGPVLFKSATGVGRLELYWGALVGAGLIELSASRAYPSPEAIGFLEDPSANLVEVVRTVARNMYGAFSKEVSDRYQEMEMGYLTRYFLLEAAVEPINTEVLKHPVRGLPDLDPRGDADIIAIAWQRLERLCDEGLVEIGSTLSIPPALLKPLVLELAKASEVAVRFKDPADEAPAVDGYPPA
ncbi:hypothetical protein [Paeniglutamicibacter psychrophenolicus]|uniref:hypothetical protein n=1 Tax=Paeniglutamicibacter psychrophenolicus TaxID=257454 RepID=UPI0027802B60|nr:hypothetical protein [Paeniglutamicibacter psychrophenolicus]MDQ0093673.1 hypothetical protein [Paeniglutamicibacter psychrophenolicus]